MQSVTTIECEACRAVLTLPGAERAQVCPYCASANVVASHAAGEKPVFCIPHAEGRAMAERALHHWQTTLGFFRHPGVSDAKLEAFHGVYLPAVLYGAASHTTYACNIAEEYFVNSSGTKKTKQKKHEWRALDGKYSAYVTDIIVSASAGLPNAELEAIEPFDFRSLRRYSNGLVAGWTVEAPTRSVAECVNVARSEFEVRHRAQLGAFLPGEGYSNLFYENRLEHESADLVLVPLWVLALKYDETKPTLRVLINGQTGKVWAEVPWSKQRLAIAATLAVVAVVAFRLFLEFMR